MPRHDKIETYSYTRWAYPSALDHQDVFRGSFREALGFVQGHDGDEDPGWMTCSIWRDRHVHSCDVCVKKGIYVITSDSLIDAASKDVVHFDEPTMTIESVAVTATAAIATEATSTKSGQTKSSRTKSSRTQKSHTKSSRSKEIRSKDHNAKASRSKTSRPKPSIQTAKPEIATSSLPAIPEEPVPLMPLWEMMAANYAAAGGDLSTLRYIGFRGLKDDRFRCSIWHEYEAQLGRGTAIGANKIQTMPGADGWDRLFGVNPYLQAVEGLIAKVNDGLSVGRKRTITIITMLPARAWTPNGFYDMIIELGAEGEYEDFVLYRGRREDNDVEHDDDQVVYKGRPAK
ncbi:hypothetical protein PFICI_01553 [Pestalotiopsis fici W106-1]|uniref:Uncharacterized protein n=1 Tax=Pestalotiopsis fici (strain W106-1 / CGMCC3.15140) TaxID=1229662 RepID=W3XP51_PESFW|nr:uncharacterized protein PFICI_01553 [Pestalotiopsis fici W106-1]ETS87725.1 hypothetical protein PFICI_01553 [Pestalotiopsis fici W106-1]